MRNIFLLIFAALALTGCPNENDIKKMMSDLKSKKSNAESNILSRQFSTNDLLETQEYFFNFMESIHLMNAEPKAIDNVRKMISEMSIERFCSDYVISKSVWIKLNEYCSKGDDYACSFEMKEFPTIIETLTQTLGQDVGAKIQSSCFN